MINAIRIITLVFVTSLFAFTPLQARQWGEPIPIGGGGPTTGGGSSTGYNGQPVTTIWVHGFQPAVAVPNKTIKCHLTTYGTGTCKQNSNGAWIPKTSDGYWKNKNQSNQVFVGHDGRLDPFSSLSTVGVPRTLDALNKHCRKDKNKWCRLVSHSMGGLIVARVLNGYSSPYNILYHETMNSAENGSILADISMGIVSPSGLGSLVMEVFGGIPLSAVYRLQRSIARYSFNHNLSGGVVTYNMGTKQNMWLVTAITLGKHDNIVSYSSQCGYPIIAGFSRCGGQDPGWLHPYTQPYTGHKSHPNYSSYGSTYAHIAGDENAYTQSYNMQFNSSLNSP